ncbi:hypothetical protein D3874_25710 [Oleomonas cavernae]|uniref:Integrin beta subunit VWA domain-containing protein n=1 Tax=Oleomonas cavernae TaxID=2320859 RepID=A0A418VTP8_9PROT|nr:VCBS domain-containing protein [Oleomonas cavernae]RJF80529.1 hypothetical protein D3874_25710 [Oleomonas cavernae]
MAGVSVSLAANVENLELSGEGTTGTGNGLDNRLAGAAGHQTLAGGDGADTLDGGVGADTMIGGAGDDTYYVDDAGDLVIEDAAGGVDTVVSAFDVTSIAANIENLRLTGTAHSAVGNAGDNRLSGGDGDDTLDGGDGDDLELGGDGDDTLVSRAGVDTLSGGSGDDRYVLSGGSAHVEDFLGHDTIDCSEAEGDSYIDLSGETASSVEGQSCDLGQGGTTAGPLDVQFLQDLSGSFGDDIATVRGLVPSIVTALRGVQTDSLFGASTFIDKPVSPFGAAGEWVYAQALGLTADTAALTATYNGMVIRNGADEPESQIEALMQLALHAGDVGYRADSARFAVLFTDAPFHQAGDGAAGGITTPNNGDGLTPGNGALEDYPTIAQLSVALTAANLIPIFAIANGYESVYQGLVTTLGRGAVVTLTADSSNVVAAITTGLTAATTTRIEDAVGGAGGDTIKGGVEDNHLWGGAGGDTLDGASGDDTLEGGVGDDAIHGGAGDDIAVFGGAWADYDISETAGVLAVADRRAGGDGTDSVDGVEHVAFATGTFTAADIVNSGPAAADDIGASLREAGSGETSAPPATGNVLANDSDVNLATAGLGEVLTVAAARAGASAASGVFQAVGGATGIDGLYGRLTINADGSYSYALDDSRPATQALATGDLVRDIFTYRVADLHGATDTAELSFAVSGTTDAATAAVTAASDKLLVTVGLDSALAASVLLANDKVVPGETLTVTGISNAVGVTVTLVDGRLVINAAGAVAGFDYAVASASGGTAAGHVTLAGITTTDAAERLSTGGSYAAADLQGRGGNDTLTGGNGNDRILGDLGSDRLTGGAGDDLLVGLAGHDTLIGGTGADRMEGGLDADSYVVDDVGDLVAELLGEGSDSVSTSLAAYTLTANVEKLKATGAGAFTGTGNELANIITGGSGDDLLLGLGGKDRLVGGLGNDTLAGGAAADSLTGSGGGDLFRFDALSDLSTRQTTSDTVADFSSAEGDRLDLGRIDADSISAGDQAFAFIGTAAFGHHAGELRYVAGTGSSAVYGDVDGNGVADFMLTLAGVAALASTDFLL